MNVLECAHLLHGPDDRRAEGRRLDIPAPAERRCGPGPFARPDDLRMPAGGQGVAGAPGLFEGVATSSRRTGMAGQGPAFLTRNGPRQFPGCLSSPAVRSEPGCHVTARRLGTGGGSSCQIADRPPASRAMAPRASRRRAHCRSGAHASQPAARCCGSGGRANGNPRDDRCDYQFRAPRGIRLPSVSNWPPASRQTPSRLTVSPGEMSQRVPARHDCPPSPVSPSPA